MNTAGKSKVFASVLVAATLGQSAQADPKANRSHPRIPMQNDKERVVMVTGSRVKVCSIGTMTLYNLRIYTKAKFESTGRFTPAGALALDPAITLTGR